MMLIKLIGKGKYQYQYHIISDDYKFLHPYGVDSTNELHTIFVDIISNLAGIGDIDGFCKVMGYRYEVMSSDFNSLEELQEKHPEYWY